MSLITMINKIKEHIEFHYLFDKNIAAHFDSSGIEYIPEEVLNKIKDFDDSIMCELYCIAFIEYMIAGKTLLDYTTLFSLNKYKKNYKIIHKYLKDEYGKRKYKF